MWIWFMYPALLWRWRRSPRAIRRSIPLRFPARFSARICEALAVDPAANAPHLAKWAKRVQNSNNKDFVEAQTSRSYSRPDHRVRVDRWRENLTDEEAAAIWDIVGETAQALGYPAPVRNRR